MPGTAASPESCAGTATRSGAVAQPASTTANAQSVAKNLADPRTTRDMASLTLNTPPRPRRGKLCQLGAV